MSYNLNIIIDILSEILIVYTNGATYNGRYYEIRDKQKFDEIYINTLYISDFNLAHVRDLGNRAGFEISRITSRGKKFLIRTSILKAINQEKFTEEDIVQTLQLKQDTVNVHLEYLKRKELISAAKAYSPTKVGVCEYHNCTLTSKGRVALEDPSYLVEESNMSNNEYNFHSPVGSVGNQGIQTNVAGINQGNQIKTQYNSEPKQTLAEAAAEIQKLLKQLEQTNPKATSEQQQAYVDAAIPPTLKERCIGALKAGGETAIEEFLDNSYINVGKAVVKGWIQP